MKKRTGLAKSALMCLLSVFLLSSCQTSKAKEYEKLRQAWTPEVRDAFIDMGKTKGCFTIKEITEKSGGKTGCYSSSSSFDKAKGQWVTECEPLCRTEEPRCYADGWKPPLSERCKRSEEWHRQHDR